MPSMHKAHSEIPSTKNKQKRFFYKSGLRHFGRQQLGKLSWRKGGPGRGRRDRGHSWGKEQGWAGRKNKCNEGHDISPTLRYLQNLTLLPLCTLITTFGTYPWPLSLSCKSVHSTLYISERVSHWIQNSRLTGLADKKLQRDLSPLPSAEITHMSSSHTVAKNLNSGPHICIASLSTHLTPTCFIVFDLLRQVLTI